ncbi:hypothetical protein HWV62_26126 [Athelia sp. TMB]|nr:hypothetical protein HWV62_26126 [Athelia sp. TMB]
MLYTSSVTYCQPPEAILIERFELAYFAANESLSFNISAASVSTNVNVTADIAVNVYGLHPFTFKIDLCTVLSGALCPLPAYNFTGAYSLALPSSLGISGRIPGVAYKIPDLEAFVQMTLIETSTGINKACVQSTLSNGWSTRQPGVAWGTGGLAFFALLSAVLQSLSPEALAPFRLLDLIYMYQTISATAFLNLNYPSLYRAFTLNFSWAMGLFGSERVTGLQDSINNMRHLTGGDMADATGGSVVGLVNRKLSPYNDALLLPSSPQSLAAIRQSYVAPLSNFANMDFNSTAHGASVAARDVATVTTASSNVLQAGIPIWSNSLGIATANAFMTVFLSVLMLLGILLGALALGYAVVFALSRSQSKTGARFMEFRYRYPAFARAWLLRIILISFPPVIIFTFYQWSLKDSWLSILLSVLMLIAVVGYIGYISFVTIRTARRDTALTLYTNTEHLAAHGPLYAYYRTPRYYFTLPLLIATFFKALFIAFVQVNGEVQIILILVVEFAVMTSYFVLKPHKTKGADVFGTYLAITRVCCTGIMVAFVEQIGLSAIPRVVCGAIMAVLFSVAIIALFINILIHFFRLFKKPSQTVQSDAASGSIVEKGADGSSPSDTESQTHLGRPSNPTPEMNVRMDPRVIQPYSSTLTDPITANYSPNSDATSLSNLGTELPRRWSFHRTPELSEYSDSPDSPNYSSAPTTPRRSVPPSPLTTNIGHHGHSRQPTVEEHYDSPPHAL